MTETFVFRWTREGVFTFPWHPFETFDQLALTPSLRDKLIQKVDLFLRSKEALLNTGLPWRYGIFLYGPSGSGKSASSKALARALEWNHFTIPAHEITGPHVLEKALAQAISRPQCVVVLEDVDLLMRVMEPQVFFNLIDHCMERSSSTFWIANSRHPENTPKTQLIRPGRFDEAVRLEMPSPAIRKELFEKIFKKLSIPSNEKDVSKWIERTEGLNFFHFMEMQHIILYSMLERPDFEELWSRLDFYIDDQLIARDRWGSLSDTAVELEQRTQHADPRLLSAALDMTHIFKRLIEKEISTSLEDQNDIDTDLAS